jgi:hypothetical protein
MNSDSGFLAIQVLWWLTLVELAVLLLILFWRVRQRNFPWFMASLFLVGLRSVLNRVAHDVPSVTMNAVSIAVDNLAALAALLVLVELTRRVFAGVKRRTWILWTLAIVAVAAGAIAIWGPWPAAETLSADSTAAVLRLLELVAQKAALLVNVLTVELCLLVFYFGSRFDAGWHSYKQRLAIGLSMSSMGQLVVLGLWQLMAITAAPKDLTDYLHIQDIGRRLVDANMVVYLIVLVWWMFTLGKTRGRKIWKNRDQSVWSDKAPMESTRRRRTF